MCGFDLVSESAAAEAIDPMQQAQNRMMPNQPGLAMTHDLQQSRAHGLAIAVGGTVVATQFGFAEDTVIQPLVGVAVQLPAVGAEGRAAMLIGAVEVDHGAQGAFLPKDPPATVGRSQACLATRSDIILGCGLRVHLCLAGHGTDLIWEPEVGNYPFAGLACVDICQQN